MNKNHKICWIIFSLLCACSNSELYTTEDFSTEAISLINDSLENASIEEETSTTGATTDSSKIKKDSSSTKKDSTNVKKDPSSTKKGSANVKKDSSSVKKDSTSVKKDSSSVKKDSANVKKDSSSVKKDSTSVKKDSTNVISERITFTQLLPDAGFKEPFTLSPPMAFGIVRCTFDGSEPDSTTPAFSEAQSIDSSTVVRCTEFVNGNVVRKQSETYFINEQINMPVVSISVAPNFVQDYLDEPPCSPNPCSGAKFWEDIEYPAHVEYFAEGSASKAKSFEIDAGISISGNYSRNQQKKSVAVVMRKQYQSGRINFPLFDTRPEKSTFKSFILRNNGNRFVSDYIGDAMATSLLEGTNVDYQRSRQVIVFYNGDYRGIYDMREKLNEHFVETNYNIDHNNVDFIKISLNEINVQNGTADDYLNLMRFIESANFIDDNTAYESVSKKIDIPNFMEYIAAEIYYANDDWPHNNVRAWKSGNSPWKFVAFDIDQGLDWSARMAGWTENTNMIDWTISGGKANTNCSEGGDYICFPNIFAKLIKNSDFKQAFINRAAYLYSTFINSTKIFQQIDYINSTIEKAQITRDQKRYNRRTYKNACNDGFDADGLCLKAWSYNRDKTVRTEFKEAFDLNDEVPITIEVKGNGILKLDDFDIKQSQEYKWDVFEHHPMRLSVECPTAFIAWEDGSTDPNRIIDPIRDSIYTAECQ